MKVDGVSRSSRLRRWGLLIAVTAVSACNPRPFGDRPPSTRRPIPSVLPPRTSHYVASNRNVDLLFLVDDSSSMRLAQDNLVRSFPAS